jgi:hypothetical protein
MMGMAGALTFAPPAWSQSNGASAPPSPAKDESPGTTIIGDRESPIGLYLTPWKNEYAESGMDRPAQNVQEPMAPIDPDVFIRQNSYYDTITRFRQAELGSKK